MTLLFLALNDSAKAPSPGSSSFGKVSTSKISHETSKAVHSSAADVAAVAPLGAERGHHQCSRSSHQVNAPGPAPVLVTGPGRKRLGPAHSEAGQAIFPGGRDLPGLFVGKEDAVEAQAMLGQPPRLEEKDGAGRLVDSVVCTSSVEDVVVPWQKILRGSPAVQQSSPTVSTLAEAVQRGGQPRSRKEERASNTNQRAQFRMSKMPASMTWPVARRCLETYSSHLPERSPARARASTGTAEAGGAAGPRGAPPPAGAAGAAGAAAPGHAVAPATAAAGFRGEAVDE